VRFPASLVAFIVGLLMAGIGVGLLTVWASDEVPMAYSEEVEDAPLTVINADLIDPEAEREEFTVSAEGEFTIALARTQDIEAWVGDAAHVTIGAVQEAEGDAEATITTEFVDGESTVPDPSGSDLWVASETTEGDLRYGWSAPDDSGEWSLLMFRDGEAPAPSAVSVELEEDPDQLPGTVLIVLGALIILLGLFLFLRSRGQSRRDHGHETDVDPSKTAAVGAGTAAAASTKSAQDDTTRTEDEDTMGENAVGTNTEDKNAEDKNTENSESSRRNDDVADDELTGVLGSISATETVYTPDALETDEPAGPTEQDDPEATGIIEPVSDDETSRDGTEEGRRWRDRSVATAAAFAIALSPAVILADAEEPSQEESTGSQEVDAEEVEAEGDGYSVLLESQLQGIVDDIAEHTNAADEEYDAELLAPRVSGNAQQVRELTYRNHELDEEVTTDPIGTEILSAAVTSSTEFPRQAVVITQGEEAEIPQVLVIEQESPRENYELTQAVLMVPGTEFPAIAAEDGGVEPVEPDSEEALFAANHAMERVAVFLNNSEYYFGMHVEENAYIEDLQAYQDELRESASDLSITYTRPLIGEGTTAMRLPDGSVLAVGSFDSTTQLRPEEGASINFSGVTAELAETESTTADTDIINRESMILHIPADNSEKVVVLGVHDIVNEVNTLD